MLIKACPECGVTRELTVDHIVPAWLRQYTVHFGLSHPEVCARAGLDIYLTRRVCCYCNMAKSGSIVYRDPIVRKYMTTFVEMVQEKIETSWKKRLRVVCVCKSCAPASLPSEIMKEVIAAHAGVPLTQKIEMPAGLIIPKEAHEIKA